MAERAYSMANRAASASRTRESILRATLELATEKLTVEIVLAEVAQRAGVTVQTVLRHFGSKGRLFDAVVEFGTAEIAAERRAPAGNSHEAIRVIVDHYEQRGDWVIVLLGQEASDARIGAVTAIGKRVHREWVERCFAGELGDDDGTLADLLVVATDVYTWKLLRRDRGLALAATEQRMRHLVDAILASHRRR